MKTTEENRLLSIAIKTAVEAHDGVYTRDGKPYILHPMYVMQPFLSEPLVAALAISHDVIEDSPEYSIDFYYTLGFPESWLKSLNLLTHEPDVSYDDYINEIAKDKNAIRVKMRDLEHNSKVTRLNKSELTEKDYARLSKYAKSYVYLEHCLKKL